ncbi:MAG TPA: ABC transporter permease [Dehalococcoidia bacterium]|jgi:peptide/nickel transport system permease protein|nr:ABC transporter permease [Dehalococcoidia bacterium]
MGRYVAQRVLLAIPTLLGVTILVFVVLRVLLPSNIVNIILGDFGHNDPQLRASISKQLGLTGSLPAQYLRWLVGILHGDLGKSLQSNRSIAGELRTRVPVSLELGLWGLVTSLLWSIPLGVWAAVKQDRFPDYGIRAVAILLAAVPGFWIAILVITFGSLWFNWAPPIHFKSLTQDPIAHLKIMLTPGLIIGLTPSAGLLRLVRTVMLEVLREDFVRTARAKGLAGRVVLFRHALRNAMIPVVTVVGVSLPGLIAGTVIFENIFNIPGMGRYLVDSVNRYDYTVIQATTLIFAALLVLCVLAVDISYALLDPRIRYQ